jgi:hypothetical protein
MSEKLKNKLLLLTEEKSKKFKAPAEFFISLKNSSFTRLELMIIDSALKKMPLDNLHKTLLLPEQRFYVLIEDIIKKLETNYFDA